MKRKSKFFELNHQLLIELKARGINSYVISCKENASETTVNSFDDIRYEIDQRVVPNISQPSCLTFCQIILILSTFRLFLYITGESIVPRPGCCQPSVVLLSESLLETNISKETRTIPNKLLCKCYSHIFTLLELHWCSHFILFILHVLICSTVTSVSVWSLLVLHFLCIKGWGCWLGKLKTATLLQIHPSCSTIVALSPYQHPQCLLSLADWQLPLTFSRLHQCNHHELND